MNYDYMIGFSIGYFDAATAAVVRPLDPLFVQQCLVQAGGLLPEEAWPAAEVQRRQETAKTRGWHVIGILGAEAITLSARGDLSLTVGYGPNPAMRAFVSMMAIEGCTVRAGDGGSIDNVLTALAVAEARWTAYRKG